MSATHEPLIWNATISGLLERAAYDINDESTIQEIKARTSLSDKEVSDVLLGNREATVEALYRIASMLNVPAADLINPSNTVIPVYSVDGGKSRTISLCQEDGALAEQLSNKQLMYAEGMDDSYEPVPTSALVVFANNYEEPKVDKLYILESGLARYVRRCTMVDVKKHIALMTNDARDHDLLITTTVKFAKLKTVRADKEMILGRVLFIVVRC